MLKLIKTIVDTNRNLVGFVIEGSSKEFGEIGANRVQRGVPLSEMFNSGFHNNQVDCRNKALIENNNFSINNLPMCVYLPNGRYVDIDNTVTIVKRFLKDNEPIGFTLEFADKSKMNYNYSQTVLISKWFRPGNYVVRTLENNKKYIAGKPGVRLEELPTQVIGEQPKKKLKRAKSKTAPETGSMEITNEFDILDLYSLINSLGGYILKLPREKYEATQEKKYETSSEFIPLNIGEIADPVLKYSRTKLNVNAHFKKMGKVDALIQGNQMSFYTYTFADKCIFSNGKNHMRYFGIAVTPESEAPLIERFGRALAIEPITDNLVIQPVCALTGKPTLKLYKVDTSKLALLSDNKLSKSVLSTQEIVELLKESYELELISKYVSPRAGIISSLKKELKPSEIMKATGAKLSGMFAAMTPEALADIAAAGIDIYNGSFKRVVGVAKKDSTSASKDDTEADKVEPVEIEYSLTGYTVGKTTGKDIKKWVANKDDSKLPANIIEKLYPIETCNNPVAQLQMAYNLNKAVDKELAEINRKLWMHNSAMFVMGSGARAHSHDKKDWVIDEKSRVKTGTAYKCVAPGCEGLRLKLKGLTI